MGSSSEKLNPSSRLIPGLMILNDIERDVHIRYIESRFFFSYILIIKEKHLGG